MGVTALAQVGKAVVSNALKFIPGAGTLIGGAISLATAIGITEAVGQACYFCAGEVLRYENRAYINAKQHQLHHNTLRQST
jgi:uncharacterized protein (DUF697 family)